MIAHIDETPQLITMCGADIKLADLNGWEKVKEHANNVGKNLKLENNYIKSNLKEFINSKELDKKALETVNDNWWHGFQHGIGLLGQVSVLAYLKNITKLYIASSYTEKEARIGCASDPTIDNQLRFVNCIVEHDQYNFSRQDKIKSIIKYSETKNIYPQLRVCWEKGGGENCSNCEKCYRTIYEIITTGGNPNNYGFTYNKKINKKAKYDILYKINITESQLTFWLDIQNAIKSNPEILKKYPEIEWICTVNFEKIENPWRKIRKKIGKLKRKILERTKNAK